MYGVLVSGEQTWFNYNLALISPVSALIEESWGKCLMISKLHSGIGQQLLKLFSWPA